VAKKKPSGHDRAFLEAILETPDDDTPRLVYADWLDDNDQGHRAEFIRIQCRLDRMDEFDPERLALEQREADLLAVHGESWKPPVPSWVHLKHGHPFRRGFLEQASSTATDFLKRGAGLFAVTPVSQLQIRNLRDKMAQLAASPLLAHVPGLNFHESDLSPAELDTLGASPHLGNLRELALGWTRLSGATASSLAGWPILSRLRRLTLAAGDAEALEELTRSRCLTALRRLNWSGPAGPAGLRGLADAAPALAEVVLSGMEIAPEGWAALARQPALASLCVDCERQSADALAEVGLAESLSSLELIRTRLSPAAVRSLAAGPRLRHLSMYMTVLDAQVVRMLTAATQGTLVHLDLPRAELEAEAATLLATAPRLAGLRRLDLSYNSLGDDGAIALAGSPHLTSLTYLDLNSCALTPRGIAALAASPNLAGLRYLNLASNELGPEGAEVLAASPHLGELRVLDLTAVKADEKGVRALASSGGLPNLRRLVLYNNGLSSRKRALREFADPSRLPALLSLGLEPGVRETADLIELGRPLRP
jgi:uncharacterized protein (TIGR02996 family)